MEDAGEQSGRYVFVGESERRINDCAFELVMPPVGGVEVLAYGNGHVEERTGGQDFYAVGTLRKEGSWLGLPGGC